MIRATTIHQSKLKMNLRLANTAVNTIQIRINKNQRLKVANNLRSRKSQALINIRKPRRIKKAVKIQVTLIRVLRRLILQKVKTHAAWSMKFVNRKLLVSLNK